MKTSTDFFQIFCAISVHKKAAKNTQAKVLEKNSSWQHTLMHSTADDAPPPILYSSKNPRNNPSSNSRTFLAPFGLLEILLRKGFRCKTTFISTLFAKVAFKNPAKLRISNLIAFFSSDAKKYWIIIIIYLLASLLYHIYISGLLHEGRYFADIRTQKQTNDTLWK